MPQVQIEKDGHSIHIDQVLLEEHKTLGWQVAIASIDVANVAITIGDETANTVNLALQLLDSRGDNLCVEMSIIAFLSDDPDGMTVISTSPNGHVAAGMNGGCVHLVTDKVFLLNADANGQLDIDIVESGAATWYLVFMFPTGKRIVSAAITFTSGSLTLPQVASAILLCGLDALTDIVLLADNDPISTFADTYGEGHNFTQTGDARPTKKTVDGYPAAYFGGYLAPAIQYMQTIAFANALAQFAVFVVAKFDGDVNDDSALLTKINNIFTDSGWEVDISDAANTTIGLFLRDDNSDTFAVDNAAYTGDFIVGCIEWLGDNVGHAYVNGNNDNEQITGGLSGSFSNNEPVRLGGNGENIANGDGFSGWDRTTFVYEITDPDNWAVDRSRLVAWSAFRYGILKSVEIGLIAANIITVQFVGDVAASNFSTGMAFTINSLPAVILSAAQQTDHSIVWYTLAAPVLNGNTVTMDYSGGNIVSDTTGENTPLGNIANRTVVNNVA